MQRCIKMNLLTESARAFQGPRLEIRRRGVFFEILRSSTSMCTWDETRLLPLSFELFRGLKEPAQIASNCIFNNGLSIQRGKVILH